jgi:hypothetical protein
MSWVPETARKLSPKRYATPAKGARDSRRNPRIQPEKCGVFGSLSRIQWGVLIDFNNGGVSMPSRTDTCFGLPRVGLLVVLAGCTASACLPAQEDDGPPVSDPEALRTLVEHELPRLGSELRADRIEAEERLLEVGPAVLELLPSPDVVEDAATRDALRRLRSSLERRAARSSVRAGRVTVRGTMPLRQIIEQITVQTENPIEVRTDADATADTPLEIEFEGARFWDAVSELTGRANLRAVVDTDRNCVVLAPADENRAVARRTAGAFRIEVLSVQPRDGVVGVEFSVTPEPRLRPLFLSWSDADFVASASARDLPPLSPEAQHELPAVDRGPVRFSVVFENGADARRPAAVSVAGNLVVTTAARTQEFRFRHLTSPGPESRRSGGVSVTRRNAEFSTTRKGVRRAEIELRVVYDTGGPAFESHRTWVYHNDVSLETSDGTRLPVNDGFETLGEQNGAVAVRYRFRDLPDVPPEDFQLVYHAPTAVIDVPLEFEFKRLPFPAESEP